jgi:hypothetical protein
MPLVPENWFKPDEIVIRAASGHEIGDGIGALPSAIRFGHLFGCARFYTS